MVKRKLIPNVFLFLILFVFLFTSCPGTNTPESREFPDLPANLKFPDPPANLYDYAMLGAEWKIDKTTFSLFAPRAEKVVLKIKGKPDTSMTIDSLGIWRAEKTGIAPGTLYRFSIDGRTASDPYGKAWSWEDTNGGGWSIVIDPLYSWTDASWKIPSIDELVIYELHLKDFTSHATSSEIAVNKSENRGKYAGIIDAIGYLKELGVNAVEFLPISEFNDGGYSWGYNTQSFFAPESGFSKERSNSYPTGSQVQEFQEMVDELHKNDIAVIMDMVYNHVGNDQNAFWAIDNIYYFDYNNNGNLEDDGTPWGNHLATWRPMVKKFMYDNLKYFIETFHIDGVRFDATSYMDHNALKEVVAKLKSEYTDIIFIAEQLPNSDSLRGTGIAQWSDPFHDSIKALLRMGKFEGSNYNSDSLGKITYYTKDNGWSASPKETINYMESHDENSVRHEVLTNTGKTTEDALKATKLGALHLFTSLGTPMLMAGQEFFKDRVGQDTREANGQIDWTWYTKNENEKDVFNYYKNLIALRIAHPELRMTDPDPAGKGDFRWSITPRDWGNLGYPYTNGGDLLIGYALNVAGTKGDYRWVVALNYSTSDKALNIVFPTSGSWTILADGTEVNPDGLDSLTAEGTTESGFKASHTIPARSGFIFNQKVN